MGIINFGLSNAPETFMSLTNGVFMPFLDPLAIVCTNDILVYSKIKEEHENHLRIVLDLLKEKKLYAKLL